MSNNFNIKEIKNFNTDIKLENSLIGDLIKRILIIEKSKTNIKSSKKEPYTIEEKIELNRFSEELSQDILEDHLFHYSNVEEAVVIETENNDFRTLNHLFNFYNKIYHNVIKKMSIKRNEFEKIRLNSDVIYENIEKEIYSLIFEGFISEIKEEQKIIYISAITAFVFYKCKILIPITEEEKWL